MTTSTSLLPREHGAYAELAFPVITGLALGRPGIAAAALAAAAVLAFLVHEPIAVLTGTRGDRLRVALGPIARRRAILLTAALAASAAIALATAPSPVRLAVLVPAGLGAVLAVLAVLNRLKSLGGELVLAAAFASLTVPIGFAGGASADVVGPAAAVWWGAFAAATLEVHAVKARTKATASHQWTRWGAPVFGIWLLGCAAAATAGGVVPWPIGAAVVPPVLAVAGVHLAGVTAHRLKVVGWTIVAANLATLALLVSA